MNNQNNSDKKEKAMKEFGNVVRSIRQSKKLSMEDFGKLFNPPASKGVVSNWENGYNYPNNKRLNRIAELGNISTDDLIGVNEISKWERVLNNHQSNLEFLESINDNTEVLNLLESVKQPIEDIINRINSNESISIDEIKKYLEQLELGLDKYEMTIREQSEVIESKIESNKNAIKIAQQKLDELSNN